MKIGLDAGHGLKTSGKQTPNGIKEWTLNDKVRDKIVAILKDYDVEFVFTDNDEGNVDESLAVREKKYINCNVDAFVSIHHNAYTGKWNNATGVEVYVDKKYTADDMKLAKLVYERLVKYIKLKGRGVKKENWAVINQNRIPAILVEGGFMDSTIDYPVITSDEGQEAYAKAVAEGLIEFLDLQKKKPSTKVTYIQNERVKSWQLVMNKVYKCGLVVDGSFGPASQKQATKHQLYKKKLAVLRIRNDYVRWLQTRLKELGYYKGSIDGSFWNDTDKAVRQFQKDKKLTADGYVGVNTVKALLK